MSKLQTISLTVISDLAMGHLYEYLGKLNNLASVQYANVFVVFSEEVPFIRRNVIAP